MLMNIIFGGALLGVFIFLFFTPCVFARGIYKMQYDMLTAKENLLTFIPIVNVIAAEKAYYPSKVSKVLVGFISMIAAIALRIILFFAVPTIPMVHVVTSLLVVIAILTFYILNCIVVFCIIHDAGTKTIGSEIFYALIFPIGQYYIGSILPNEIKYAESEQETF